ncbi:hypothetical protein EIP91_008194 [Steccherinum ochraceum]|uniref:Uncharacterized protein n=1 Tax=Steccherinum ochraceum TaxID=92696 RepID=A0A4R0RU79_9APHY|nr:hypothetical protein EIP91_008194 [Steccherinum ochraceum]
MSQQRLAPSKGTNTCDDGEREIPSLGLTHISLPQALAAQSPPFTTSTFFYLPMLAMRFVTVLAGLVVMAASSVLSAPPRTNEARGYDENNLLARDYTPVARDVIQAIYARGLADASADAGPQDLAVTATTTTTALPVKRTNAPSTPPHARGTARHYTEDSWNAAWGRRPSQVGAAGTGGTPHAGGHAEAGGTPGEGQTGTGTGGATSQGPAWAGNKKTPGMDASFAQPNHKPKGS